MCRAIAEAYEVDEVKDIRDKARAIEVYAQQARNVEAERRACEIRLRAERKCGALLRQMEKAKGAPGNQHTGPLERREGSKTLGELGISYDQSSRWQKLADIPDGEFEAALGAPEHPTTTGLIAEPAGPMPVDDRALWLWGRLKDFERPYGTVACSVLGADGVGADEAAAWCAVIALHAVNSDHLTLRNNPVQVSSPHRPNTRSNSSKPASPRTTASRSSSLICMLK